MKKFKCIMLTLLLVFLSLPIFTFTSCNYSNPGKLEDIAGIYKLDTYTITPVYNRKWELIATEERVTQNIIEEKHMEVYVVIPKKENENAYYVYKDDSDLYAKEAKMHLGYSVNDEGNKSEDVNVINLDINDYNSTGIVLYVQASSKTLTNVQDAIRLQLLLTKVYYGYRENIFIKYTRVSKETSVKEVEKLMDENIPVISYDYAIFHNSTMTRNILQFNEYSDEYIYRCYKFNSITKEYICYYATKQEQEKQTSTGKFELNGNTITIGDEIFTIRTVEEETFFNLDNENYYFVFQNFTEEDLDRWIEDYKLSMEDN